MECGQALPSPHHSAAMLPHVDVDTLGKGQQ